MGSGVAASGGRIPAAVLRPSEEKHPGPSGAIIRQAASPLERRLSPVEMPKDSAAAGAPRSIPAAETSSDVSDIPIRFSDEAREMVLTFIGQEESQDYAVRVAVDSPSPLAPRYSIALVEPDELAADDRTFDAGGFRVAVDPESAELLEGASVEWVETLNETGFKVNNPNLKPIGSQPLEGPLAERVQTVIEREVNPAVAQHGGQIGLVEVRDNIVYIEMSGGCQGCGMAKVTLKQGVERMLTEAVPEIEGVEDVTDHAAGSNPYYE